MNSIVETVFILVLFVVSGYSFTIPYSSILSNNPSTTRLSFFSRPNNENTPDKQQREEMRSTGNPLSEIFDMLSNIDSVVDDFYFKRMGNGEQFYGKRKYKPSGLFDKKYEGFGLSDRRKIDMTRAHKEQWEEEKRERDALRGEL